MGSGRRQPQEGPRNECQYRDLKADAPTPDCMGPGPGCHLHQAALLAPSLGQYPPLCSPSGQHCQRRQKLRRERKGTLGRWRSLFFPSPTGQRVGIGWGSRDSGKQRDTQVGVTQRETPRAADPQSQSPRDRDLRQRETQKVLAPGWENCKRQKRLRDSARGKGHCQERG